MRFEDTKLHDHPAVREAYAAMQDFYSNSKEFHKEAICRAEALSTFAKEPDPDAVAACIFMPTYVLEKINTNAAAYLGQYYDAMEKDTTDLSEGGAQVILAHAIVGLKEDVLQKITDGEVWKYGLVKRSLDKYEQVILASAEKTEPSLAQIALHQLQTAYTALEDLARKTQDDAAFEKTGLPEHPVLRNAYMLLLSEEQKIDPLFTNRSAMGARAARVLLETGASTDPDVLGAVILNQYSRPIPDDLIKALLTTHSFEEMDKASARIRKYKAQNPDPLESLFSARLIELYRETSPFAREDRDPDVNTPAEAALVYHAIRVYVLESELQPYPQKKVDPYVTFGRLEHIEDAAEGLEKMIQDKSHPALKARMEKALAAAYAMMQAPENLKIRKPGTPPREPGW